MSSQDAQRIATALESNAAATREWIEANRAHLAALVETDRLYAIELRYRIELIEYQVREARARAKAAEQDERIKLHIADRLDLDV